jgi:hypothetical protein
MGKDLVLVQSDKVWLVTMADYEPPYQMARSARYSPISNNDWLRATGTWAKASYSVISNISWLWATGSWVKARCCLIYKLPQQMPGTARYSLIMVDYELPYQRPGTVWLVIMSYLSKGQVNSSTVQCVTMADNELHSATVYLSTG